MKCIGHMVQYCIFGLHFGRETLGVLHAYFYVPVSDGVVNMKKYLLFFFKQKTAYEIPLRLVGSEMCIRDRIYGMHRS